MQYLESGESKTIVTVGGTVTQIRQPEGEAKPTESRPGLEWAKLMKTLDDMGAGIGPYSPSPPNPCPPSAS